MFPFKVCCIKSVEEAELAIRYGALKIGLVAEMPSGPGVLPIDKIAEIAKAVSGRISTWLLTSKTSFGEIASEFQLANTNAIQLVDEVNQHTCEQLKHAFPSVELVQVRHVSANQSPRELANVHPYIDALLLDSGNPNAEIKILGGTGNTHDWNISKEIVRLSYVPVYLAGGLNPTNARDAIAHVSPYGLDICSGLRVNGELSELLIAEWSEKLSQNNTNQAN